MKTYLINIVDVAHETKIVSAELIEADTKKEAIAKAWDELRYRCSVTVNELPSIKIDKED